MTLTADEAVLRDVVGAATLARGRDIFRSGAVLRAQSPDDSGHVYGEVRGTARRPYSSIALVSRRSDGTLSTFRGSCTCPVGANCKHTVALVLAALPSAEPAETSAADAGRGKAVAASAQWERSLAGLVRADAPAERADPTIALQFELATARGQRPGLRLRPVLPGAGGGWVRAGVTWATVDYLSYSHREVPAELVRLLSEIAAVDAAGSGGYSTPAHAVELSSIASRRIWDLLAEADALGVPFVEAGRSAAPVVLHRAPADVRLDIVRDGGDLLLQPRISVGVEPLPTAEHLLLGEPAHGIAWWQRGGAGSGLRLARFADPLDDVLTGLVREQQVRVPQRDEARFLAGYYPALRRRLTVVSPDSSVPLPQPGPPRLLLSIAYRPGHRVDLDWRWRYAVGDTVRDEPLHPSSGSRGGRELEAERNTLQAVADLTTDLAGCAGLYATTRDGSRLAPTARLEGIAAVRFTTDVLPGLREINDLDIATTGSPTSYRAASAEPVIAISGTTTADDRDWFDLAVTVSVDSEDVPFEQLFLAVAAGESHLILPSGTYFALDHAEFGQLAELIAEARALQDSPGNTLRLSRFQTSLWDDLDRLGVIGGQAATWQQSVQALADVDGLAEVAVPSGLQATLRPYQQAGFQWLAFLYTHGLGGILADEMGLGKTMQAIALMAHVREQHLSSAPFLVVAPTSVVLNWAAECRRFAPGLAVQVVTETGSRRGCDLGSAIAGADVVITSYTLFRLEHDEYAALEWAGLFLDEAQFAKNRQSQNYACAKRLPTAFKLAITGTPMENNLGELWSLLSITAPGLFPSPTRFDTFYRKPIEKGRAPELLTRLRSRVRPLMLRRAKRDVLSELPDKQEQVVELALNPRHARAYETHLQRERQKVLGLLDDLEGNRFAIFRSLTLLRQACLDAGLVDDTHVGIPSTKLDALLELLGEIAGAGHRTLVFSQFTRFLAAARRRLDAAGIEYCYLDGSTRDRAGVLDEFKSGTAPVFLISLKAGGFGLNLTEADYCILLDPWWNPATEAQAIDRTHRIGQHKKVMVYRLVAKGTIEEKVMALKEGKAALFDSVLGDGAFSSSRLSADDIRGMLD